MTAFLLAYVKYWLMAFGMGATIAFIARLCCGFSDGEWFRKEEADA